MNFNTPHNDERYIVLDKPFDVRLDLGHSGARRYPEEITVADWLIDEHGFSTLRFCHQLDAATSGALVIAKDKGAAAAATKLFSTRRVKKFYHALVFGTVDANAPQVISAPVGPVDGSDFLQRVYEIGNPVGKVAETKLTVLRQGTFCLPGPHFGKPVTHVLLEPLTGRRHQLRVHCKHIGHPMVGDANYANDWHTYRLFLHAHRIIIEPLPEPTGKIDVATECADFSEAIS